KSSKRTLIRQLCGGDFKTNRFGFLNVSACRNRRKSRFHVASSRADKPSRSKYSEYCGERFGKAIVKYGEGRPSMHKANSSSCGRSQPAFMLSMGRWLGVRNRTQRWKNFSVKRKWFGSRHS